MRLLLILLIIFLGLAAGTALTVYLTGPGSTLFSRRVGQWVFSPTAGDVSIDPYTRARLFAEGGLPLAAGEGYTLRTRRDATGAPLEGRCSYHLSSPFPPARYWTVTLTDGAGRLPTNLSKRQGFTSAEIIRDSGGAFGIEIGPAPLAGNWLPTLPFTGAIEVFLRFYETPLSATATQFDERTLPVLTKTGCPA
jgi:hypothetical protein